MTLVQRERSRLGLTALPLRPVLLTLALLVSPTSTSGQPPSYAGERLRFAEEMAQRHGFDLGRVRALLGRARYRQGIIDAMDRPYESKPWSVYRPLFVTAERVAAGVSFWRENRELLDRAQAVYGVPPELIVAILGVETGYGTRVGTHLALDALTTLGFSYPRRAEFFRRELEELLLLDREGQVDALEALGSYAGALGKPQFIPSSYRTYAVDFDGDGKRDLWGSNADVIGSVASYLHRHGWRPEGPVAVRARVPVTLSQEIEVAEKRPLAPNTTAGQLRAMGVEWPDDIEAETPATLVRLDGAEEEYWVALENYYVITRYNNSNLYAMAVYQLGQEIKGRYRAGT